MIITIRYTAEYSESTECSWTQYRNVLTFFILLVRCRFCGTHHSILGVVWDSNFALIINSSFTASNPRGDRRWIYLQMRDAFAWRSSSWKWPGRDAPKRTSHCIFRQFEIMLIYKFYPRASPLPLFIFHKQNYRRINFQFRIRNSDSKPHVHSFVFRKKKLTASDRHYRNENIIPNVCECCSNAGANTVECKCDAQVLFKYTVLCRHSSCVSFYSYFVMMTDEWQVRARVYIIEFGENKQHIKMKREKRTSEKYRLNDVEKRPIQFAYSSQKYRIVAAPSLVYVEMHALKTKKRTEKEKNMWFAG